MTKNNQALTHPWTWRQYALFRMLFAAYLFVHFIQVLPWGTELFSQFGMIPNAQNSPLIDVFPNLLAIFDTPVIVASLITSGAIAALCLLCGRFDRIAAVWLWFLLASLFARNPLIANPSLPVVGWMLLFHALLPRRCEPWDQQSGTRVASLPRLFVIAAWALLAVAYSYSGWTKLFSDAWVQGETVRWVLENPLARDTWLRTGLLATPEWLLHTVTIGILVVELLFLPLALVRTIRPWVWLIMLGVQIGFLVLLNFADLTIPMLLIHLLTFDPNWLPAKTTSNNAIVYYDGDCGLCHTSVKFVLAEDHRAHFNFAPMQSEKARADVSDIANSEDFSSMVVITPEGQRLEKFAAARFILHSLGGLWRIVAWLSVLVPERLGNMAYSIVAKNRRRFFKAPNELCPLLPSHYAARFKLSR